FISTFDCGSGLLSDGDRLCLKNFTPYTLHSFVESKEFPNIELGLSASSSDETKATAYSRIQHEIEALEAGIWARRNRHNSLSIISRLPRETLSVFQLNSHVARNLLTTCVPSVVPLASRCTGLPEFLEPSSPPTEKMDKRDVTVLKNGASGRRWTAPSDR
ncbi:hypothetical protein Hypma_002833, partial [Hypsizygus marmoreus]